MHTFDITYRVAVTEGEEIDQKVDGICLEQSVELPRSILSGEIETKIVGQVSELRELEERVYHVVISWPLENVGRDVSQFLNILYGNISLQPGIRITGIGWEKLNGTLFDGPAFGIDKLRKMYSIRNRGLSGTAIKPLGSSVEELAELCYKFACGGIDIIKDDHGIANQSYSPFKERVQACVGAVQRAADETGNRSYYFANVTALASDSVTRYQQAAELGADGVLICPHIAGMETMHQLARMDIPLPIIAHPSFSGGLTTHKDQGLTPGLLYGQLWRALGADFAIYPNVGGRFSFTLDECKAVNEGARNATISYRKTFPMPGGGMDVETISKWKETYGADTVFLVGGSLYNYPGGVLEAARKLTDALK